MTSALDQASALLDGSLSVRVHSVRAAAWVTRSALEEILGELVRAKGFEPGQANTRTLLGCIEVLYQEDAPQLASAAQYAWDSLSQASHHHAYELAPTHAEVSALTDLVKSLASYATSPSDASGKPAVRSAPLRDHTQRPPSEVRSRIAR